MSASVGESGGGIVTLVMFVFWLCFWTAMLLFLLGTLGVIEKSDSFAAIVSVGLGVLLSLALHNKIRIDREAKYH
jgi:hypothetical protein